MRLPWQRKDSPASQRDGVRAEPTQTGPEERPSGESGPISWGVGETVLGTYRIEERLGAGGMGVVHRVRHLDWGLDLAVKSPLPRMWLSGVQAFVDEAEVWVGLPPHPNVCTCHYVRVLGGVPRIFAEFVEGGTVAEALEAGRLRDLDGILDVAIQLAWGLRAAHEAGVVHQDVKPSNALLTADGLVKITDFGLARAQQRSEGADGVAEPESILVTHRGLTPAYASPEQSRGQRAGRPGDVWSWAVTVLELFTGEVTWTLGAFAGAALDEYRARGAAPGRPVMPGEVAALLKECFTVDPAARPADLSALADRLVTAYATHVGRPYPRTATSPMAVRADGFNNKALSMLDLGRTGQARQFWGQALEADPRHLDATFNSKLGQWREGELTDLQLIAHLERFRFSLPESDPGRARLAYALGVVRLERRDLAAAKAQLGEAASGDPDVAAALDAVDRAEPVRLRTLELPEQEGKTCPLAIAPTGRYAVSGGEDRTVRWWDLASGRCLRILTGHTDLVCGVALSEDGRSALSGAMDGTVRWWDLVEGTGLRTFTGSDGVPFFCVALSEDGRNALAGDAQGALWWWDLTTGQCLRKLSGHEGGVDCVVGLSGGHALSAGEDGTVRHWDLTTGEQVRTFTGHRGAVYVLTPLPGGTRFLSAGHDGAVRLWELATGRCLRVLSYPHRVLDVLTTTIFAVAATPDGRTAIVGNKEGELTWWDLSTGRCVWTVDVGGTLNSLMVAADGRTALSGGFDQTVRWWDLAPGRPAPWSYSRPRSTADLSTQAERFHGRIGAARALLDRGDAPAAAQELRAARAVVGFENDAELGSLWRRAGHSGRRTAVIGSRQTRRLETPAHLTKAVGITANGRRALSSTADTLLRWWDLTTGDCLHTLDAGDGFAFTAAVTPDGRHAVSVGDRKVHWWDLSSGKRRAVLPLGTDEGMTFAVAITPDGRRAVSAGTDRVLRWWDLAGGRCLRTLAGHEAHLNAVAVTADGRHALSGGADHTLRYWDLTTGECLRTSTPDSGGVSAVAVTPDGRHAVSGSTTGAVFAWDLASGEGRELPGRHTAQLNSVAITADGRHALSGGEDTTMRWWDLAEGRCLHQVKETYVASAAMTPSGHHVLSGMSDGSVLLWEVDWDYEF
jgi:WD40 repeat protein/serine/threonine protein kinase